MSNVHDEAAVALVLAGIQMFREYLDRAEREVRRARNGHEAVARTMNQIAWGNANAISSIESAMSCLEDARSVLRDDLDQMKRELDRNPQP